MRHSVDYLYSLYDALTGINVPNDKARAVVDAMERDMGATLATKSDLEQLRGEMRQEFALVRKDMEILSGSLRGEIAGVRKDLDSLGNNLRSEIGSVRKDMDVQATGLRKDMELQAAAYRNDMELHAAAFRKDMELLSTTMTIRLGSMLVVGFGLIIASLRFVVG